MLGNLILFIVHSSKYAKNLFENYFLKLKTNIFMLILLVDIYCAF